MKTITQALTCALGHNFAETDTIVGIPDEARAQLQHLSYRDALEKCGVRVTTLPAGSAPIQGLAVVADFLAVLSAGQRDVASALAGCRYLKFITPPGLLDGRDVLRIDDQFYIGLSDGTNEEGAAQLAFHLIEYGYQATVIDTGGLRLGSSAVDLGNNRLLIREELAKHFAFLTYDKITVSYTERGAANAQMVNGTLIMPAGYATTRDAVRAKDITVIEVNVSEFEKTGAGLNCLGLMLSDTGYGRIEMPIRNEKTGKKRIAA